MRAGYSSPPWSCAAIQESRVTSALLPLRVGVCLVARRMAAAELSEAREIIGELEG